MNICFNFSFAFRFENFTDKLQNTHGLKQSDVFKIIRTSV